MFCKLVSNSMEKVVLYVCYRLMICFFVASVATTETSPNYTNGSRNNQSCSQLFCGIEVATNYSDSTKCTCDSLTQMICPMLSLKPITVLFNPTTRHFTFNYYELTCKFESVIPYVKHYVMMAQPRALHVSKCCSDDTLSDDANRSLASSIPKELLSTLHVNDLPSPTTLRKLDLSGNSFINIEGKFTTEFSELRELDLSMNFFTDFTNNTFANLQQLKVLNLATNSIITLTRATLEGLTSLTCLTLKSNQIETLLEDVFKDLPNLQYIHLGANKFQTVPSALFQSNKELRAISLESNYLTTLPSLLLAPLQRLSFFCASNNKLESIPIDIFNGLLELIEVQLNHNQLQRVSADLFAANGMISRIDLSSNNLRQIPELHLNPDGAKPLQLIKIQNNSITSIILPLTNYVSEFTEKLDISNNCIKTLTYVVKNGTNRDAEFETGIFRLICQRCCLDSIHPKLLQGIIESADFTGNAIKKIDMRVLRSISNLRTVDFTNNLITTLNVSAEYPLVKNVHKIPFERLDTRIILRHNPINCDCNVMTFLNVIKMNLTNRTYGISRSKITFDLKGVSCAQPQFLQKRKLWHFLRFPKLTEKLICNVDTNCPKRCHCYVRAVPSVTVVNCSNQHFETFPLLQELESPIELHLENNSIIRLPPKNSSLWRKLSALYLQKNRLTSMENISVTSKLTVLRLQDNHLSRYESSMQLSLSLRTVTISLSDNPWECNCELQKLKNIIVSTDNVDDFHQISCTDPQTDRVIFLANTTDYELCPPVCFNPTVLKALLFLIAAVVVVASLAIFMLLCCNEKLYICCSKKGGCLGVVTEKEFDIKQDALNYAWITEEKKIPPTSK